MPFGGLLLTNFGVQMNAKTQQGKKLVLTRVALGDGTLGSASPATFPTLLSERTSFQISAVREGDNESVIVFHFSNAELEQGFFYREIGVYAKDPDTGVEKLYLYDNCRAEGQYIDDKNNPAQRINCYMRLHIKFAQTELIEFTPGGDPIYVLYEEFYAHVQDYTTHVADNDLHTSAAEKAATTAHLADKVVHVTAAERTAWNGKATTAHYTATLTTAWSATAPFTQTVTVSGIVATDMPLIGPVLSATAATAAAQREAWNMVSDGKAAAGKVVFRCFDDKPTVDITLQIKVVR